MWEIPTYYNIYSSGCGYTLPKTMHEHVMHHQMRYEDVPDFDDKNLRSLDDQEVDKMVMSLLSVVMYGGNYALAVSSTKRFVKHSHTSLRGVAIECISHIARLWGSVPKDLIEEVNNAFNDPSEWVQAKADFAADDLEVFLKDYKRPE